MSIKLVSSPQNQNGIDIKIKCFLCANYVLYSQFLFSNGRKSQ